MKARTLATAAITIVAAGSLAACGSGSASNAASAAKSAAAQATEAAGSAAAAASSAAAKATGAASSVAAAASSAVAGATSAAASATSAAAGGGSLPNPPAGANTLQQEDIQGVAYGRYSVGETAAEVVTFYTSAFEGEGYAVNGSGGGGSGGGAQFSKSGSYAAVSAGGEPGGTTYFEVCVGANEQVVSNCENLGQNNNNQNNNNQNNNNQNNNNQNNNNQNNNNQNNNDARLDYELRLAPGLGRIQEPPPQPRHATFSAMGTWCHAIVVPAAADGPGADEAAGPLHRAQDRVAQLDSCWTRFDPASELSRLNAGRRGSWFAASPDMLTLAQHALLSWRRSAGWCDPFQADRLAALGYDRDFAEVDGPEPPGPPTRLPRMRRRGRPPLRIDARSQRLMLAAGASLDSGGIGKGLAADLVTRELLDAGALGALVNLGGDLRCAGQPPAGGWEVSLDDAWRPGEPSGWMIRLQTGAVATSSPLQRRWRYADGSWGHHLIDPRTGAPMAARFAAVSVVARSGWVAEYLTKTVLLAPETVARQQLRRAVAAAVVTEAGGERRRIG